eukprot:TRINITY_DN40372_c0_g1_i1.p1 TRINITY_DN40372_c0_g1~~TRINITY_DN40372_c0_g1_i1.p1  ORF type:complete len:326 (-),score=-10.63 TRINITY_DN40372_c0_g1_i1:177-1154(-)
MDSESSAKQVEIDAFPMFRTYKDGTVVRLGATELSEPNPNDFSEGAKSKDIVIDPSTGVLVRLYLPEHSQIARLPLLFYVHGGAFCIGSAASTLYQKYLNKVAKELRLLCVSVDYRRAPEDRLPAAYDDCFLALRWLLAGAGREDPWIASAGDVGRVFVAGDSAGGNIVHELGIRASKVEWPSDVKFEGAVYFHPFFHKTPEGDGYIRDPAGNRGGLTYDGLVSLVLPPGEKAEEYPPFNPVGPRSPPLSGIVYERALVAVAEKDSIKEGGLGYYRHLVEAGRKAEVEVTPEKDHVFHLFDLTGAAAVALMQRVYAFIHGHSFSG